MIDPVTEQNAKIAEEKYGIPHEVYIELCNTFGIGPIFERLLNENAPLKSKIATAFAYGLVIGWLKKGGKDEAIQTLLATQSTGLED